MGRYINTLHVVDTTPDGDAPLLGGSYGVPQQHHSTYKQAQVDLLPKRLKLLYRPVFGVVLR